MSELTIHGLGVGGDGVGRLDDGRIVFVSGGLPGDRVRVRLTTQKKKVQYAELVEIIEPSVSRVPSRCATTACGGCALRELSLEFQGENKTRQVHENLRRLAGIDMQGKLAPIRQLGDGWGYRHRVRLHAAWLDHRWRLGFHGRQTRTLAPFESCPVLWPELQQVVVALGDALENLSPKARIDEVELAYSRRDGRAAAVIHARGPLAIFRRDLAWFEESKLSGVAVAAGDGHFRHGNMELRYDHANADDFDLRFEPGMFTQAHPAANDALVATVLRAVNPARRPRVLELHAGIGNFSLPIGHAGCEVVAIESQRRAAMFCQRNAEAAGLAIDVRNCRDDMALADAGDFDIVLLDPPRVGARKACEVLAETGPRRVVYVSCDSATLARDAAILQRGGYVLSHTDVFDLFAQTPHVETVSVFEREGAAVG